VANFDDVAMESTPVEMDTSPWNNTGQNSRGRGENWANFSNKVPNTQNSDQENWADFSNIAELGRFVHYSCQIPAHHRAGHIVYLVLICKTFKCFQLKQTP